MFHQPFSPYEIYQRFRIGEDGNLRRFTKTGRVGCKPKVHVIDGREYIGLRHCYFAVDTAKALLTGQAHTRLQSDLIPFEIANVSPSKAP